MIRPPKTTRTALYCDLLSSTCCDSVVESERVCERIGRKIDMVCQVDKSCLHKQEEAATTQTAQNS